MNRNTLFVLAALLVLGPSAAAQAQKVYRCQLGDGSITFSDLPCESDIGEEGMVDATPHQGHRPPPDPGAPAYEMPEESREIGGGSRDRSGAVDGQESASLSRRERLSLERERKSLLSGLKRRHIGTKERRALIRELRSVDRKLGIEREDVFEMPFHDREVYEDHAIHPGLTRDIRRGPP